MVDINNGVITHYELVESALNNYFERLGTVEIGSEEIDVQDSLDRILYEDIVAQQDLPTFDRALVDGYAIDSHDVGRADDKTPAILKIIGEVNVGDVSNFSIARKEAVKISTGAMLPTNADSIVFQEDTLAEGDMLKVFRSVVVGENVAKKGEDITTGSTFIRKQRKIRPQDIGGLVCLGFRKIKVYRKPVISVIPTGNELVQLGVIPQLGQLVESNSYVLKGQIEQLGGISKIKPIVKDDLEMIKNSIIAALEDSDIVLVSGGSSVGSKDYTLESIKSIENSEIVAHGIAMRPGRQTLLAFVNGKPVIGLPGHPVSNITSFLIFVRPILIQLLENYKSFWQKKKDDVKIDAVLAKDVESPNGREDYVRVRLRLLENGKITAYPYAGKSSYISTLVRAHGMIKLPIDCTKLYEGDRVEVLLF